MADGHPSSSNPKPLPSTTWVDPMPSASFFSLHVLSSYLSPIIPFLYVSWSPSRNPEPSRCHGPRSSSVPEVHPRHRCPDPALTERIRLFRSPTGAASPCGHRTGHPHLATSMDRRSVTLEPWSRREEL
uniref:Predicted protein n=1 Tax=Hordeum vulgare subsp. vulgare TaxID=112509 RepID=F2D344_HORVV|nr:predicted protein [Hordeum vulgare subsp. vulgare]